jgi:curved DNA-binding protein CbpA
MGIGPFAGPAERAAAQGASPIPAPSPAPAPAPARPAGAPAPAVAGSAADDELRKALLAAVPRGRERDYFDRLGLADTAGRDQVKKAFLALAKQFHPDRFASPALADLNEVVRDFFAAVNEAYETLSDDRKRAEYLGRRKAGDKDRSLAAKVDYEKGEACLRTRDFGRARGFYESAVRAEPKPLYQAALAQAFVLDPTQRDRARAKALLADACKDASCDRAFFVAGVIAREEGELAQAERLFRAALQANPRGADAARELRDLERRRSEKRR